MTAEVREVAVPTLEGEFRNELLDQDLRETIAEETERVRNLLLAQAFSGLSLTDSAPTPPTIATTRWGSAGPRPPKTDRHGLPLTSDRPPRMSSALPVLNDRFRDRESFRDRAGRRYALLPMRLISLDAGRYVLTNFAGEYVVLPKETVRQLVHHELDMASDVYEELASRHFVLDGDSSVALDLLAVKYRTKQSLLANFTSLFMYVVTLRCDHSCPYCQVSRQSVDRHAYDMKPEVAEKAIDFMFRSPSRSIKVEFQGGEPLLNFALIRQIVERVEARNESEGRDLQFVIATNLAPLTDDMLAFCREHEILHLDQPRRAARSCTT